MERYIGDDEVFLATYGDGLTDAPLPDDDRHAQGERQGRALPRLAPQRPSSTSSPSTSPASSRSLEDVTKAGLWINAGYFVFRREIFDYIGEGDDLVEEPFQRLIEEERLSAYPYRGFWAPMDTLKDKQNLDSLVESGRAPWALWELGGPEPSPGLRRRSRDAHVAARDRRRARPPTILALGAHADDIEIGCGGTLLRLAEEHPDATCTGSCSAQAAAGSPRHDRVPSSSSPASRRRTSSSRTSGTASSPTAARRSRTASRGSRASSRPT